MAETENEATAWDDASEIQPEGGLNEDDILDASEFSDDALEQLFTAESAEESKETDAESGATESSPTTENDDEAAESKETAPEHTLPAKMPRKLMFTAKIDRKERPVELDESELPEIYQTAQNYGRLSAKYDKLREENLAFKALAAQLGYKSVEEMIEQTSASDRKSKVDALVDEGTPQEIAEDYIDRKIKRAKDDFHASENAERMETKPESSPDDSDDTDYFRSQVAEFFKARPDLKGKVTSLPKEVSEAVVTRKGTLREVYAEWEMRQQKADAEKLRKEKEMLAQQAEAATRAPVRGAAESPSENGGKPDRLRDAFRADMSW